MNIERKNIDAVNAIIKLQVAKSDYQEAVDNTLRNYKKKANVPGFRPGQVPASIIKKMFGKAAMADEINKIISEALLGYIKDNNIQILGEPLPNRTEQKPIDFDAQEDFEFVFDIAIAPEFNVELSDKITVPYYDINVDDKMVENGVKSYTSRFGTYDKADSVEENDVVKGELVEMRTKTKAKEDGIVVEETVLCPKYIKDDEQKALFVGAKNGSAVTFNPKKAYENEAEIASLLKIKKEEVADMTSDFKFTIKEITRFKEAELNQELFDKAFGEGVVKSEAEFKQKLSDDIKKTMEQDSDYKLLIDAKAALLKGLEGLAFPDDFLKRWVLETNEKITEKDLNEQYPMMLEDLKWHLVKEQIAKAKGIKIENNDLSDFAKKVARAQFAQYGMASVPDDVLDNYVKEMIKNKEQMNHMLDQVMDEKIMAEVKKAVKLDKKSVSLEEFNKLFQAK